MTRDEFRLQMELYRQAREQNPLLSYWLWKADRLLDNDWQYQQWRNALPENLRLETNDYDLYGAYKAGIRPHMENDGYYHLGSRDPYTGRILKTKNHPTYKKAIESEINAGYFPYEKNDWTYTKTYSPIGDLSGYDEGTNKEGVLKPYERVVGPYLDEIVVTPNGNYVNKPFDLDAYNSAVLNAWGKQTRIGPEDVVDYLPIIGDVKGVYDAANDFNNGNYLAGGIGLGLTLLPNFIEKPLKYLGVNIKNLITSSLFNKINTDNLNKVNKLFRNSEWSNFISTRNGDNYYRLSSKPGLVSTNVRTDNGGYFISHTTPWEEFTGLGTSDPIGSNILYEFPTKTFGKLKSSNSRGIIGDLDVTELGKQHLLYGNTASSERIPVRLVDDDTATLLNMDAYTIGIKDRPLTYKGFYDTNPIYEQLSLGNLTTVSPELLNNAILNTSYKMFRNTPNGVQKELYVPYSEGTDKEGIQSTSERPVTVNPYTGEFEYGYNPGAGYLRSVINTRDLLDFTPVGNATTAYDAYNAYDTGDYLGAGLIGAAALLPGAIAKPAKNVIKRIIPEVHPNYVSDKLNQLIRKNKEVKPNGLTSLMYEDAINLRNHILEELQNNQAYWDRAADIQKEFGDDYTSAYIDAVEGYWNGYLGMPEPKLGAEGVRASMNAKPDAIDRFNKTGLPAGIYDFEYQLNPNYEVTNPITRHELSHYIDFNVAKHGNADKNNAMFREMKKDLSKDKNPMYPDNTSYYSQGTEQKSYMNTLRQYMYDTGLIESIGDKVTTKQIKNAIKTLPELYNSIKAAFKQFKTPSSYTKWFNKMPLLTIPGAAMYIQNNSNKESN